MDLWQRWLAPDGAPTGPPLRLTTGVEMLYARFSPDGRHLAYSKGRKMGNIWRVPILEDRPARWSDAQQLTQGQGRPSHVSLSPDKKALVFCLLGPEAKHIWTMSAEGGDPERILLDSREQVWARWSPDGETIAFHSGGDIWIVPRAGGPARRLTEDNAFEGAPAWSPDGRHIAYLKLRDGSLGLSIVPAEGGEARSLIHEPADVQYKAWSPDGRHIAFNSSRSGTMDIWVVPSAGGEPRPLTRDADHDERPFWSPDGKWVLFYSDRPGGTVWRVAAEGGQVEPFLKDGWSPIWSPDRRTTYFAARREGRRSTGLPGGLARMGLPGRSNLYERTSGSTAERQLTDLVGKRGYLRSLDDTDGEFLYFTWREDEGDLWVMDVEQSP
jgi:Tol biopolymer transport system component